MASFTSGIINDDKKPAWLQNTITNDHTVEVIIQYKLHIRTFQPKIISDFRVETPYLQSLCNYIAFF